MKWFWIILIGILILMIGNMLMRAEMSLEIILLIGILIVLCVLVVVVVTGFTERK